MEITILHFSELVLDSYLFKTKWRFFFKNFYVFVWIKS